MVTPVRPKTYNKYLSDVTAVASVATIDSIDQTLLNHFIGIHWFSDSVGATKVTPTDGTVLIEVFDDVTEQWTTAEGKPLDATSLTDKMSYSANITSVRATPASVATATHYRLIMISNVEGSPEISDFAASFEHTDRGGIGLGVFVQDQTTPPLDVPFLKERAALTIAVTTAVDDRTVELGAGHSVVAGEILELAQMDTGIFMQSEVLSVSVNTITLDQPINAIYTTSDVVIAANEDLLVDGSVTPQVFSILPGPTQSGDIVRVIFNIRSTDSMDFSTFGGDAALTNGCVIRVKNSDGTFRNLFNFKDNGDIIEQCFDHAFLLPRTGNTVKGFTARITYGGQEKHGVVIRLDGSLDEQLQIVIQDDLTAGTNTLFHMIGQGSELQGE